MNPAKLKKIRREIQALYGSDRKSRELEGIAKKLHREKVKRGSYTWENTAFPDLPPLSIPHHSKGVKRFTAESILDQLQAQDIWAWEQRFEAAERRRADGEQG